MINRKLLKEPEGKKDILHTKKQKSVCNQTSYLNKAIQKTVDKKKERKKKLVNLEFCTQ